MDSNKKEDQEVDVNFEAHPPIESDLDGVVTLLRQSLLQLVDVQSLAKYLIAQKDVTQIIALEGDTADDEDDDDDEPDDEIYGVSSVIELPTSKNNDDLQLEARKQLVKYLKGKSSELKKLCDDSNNKLALIVNERYINLPPQLALPTLKSLSQHIDASRYTHLVFVSKILLKARNTETKLPSKKSKSGHTGSAASEPLIYVNAEEEIIFEGCENSVDIDVSSFCDENATWSSSSDAKYIPHRRIMIVDQKKWSNIIKNLEEELK